MVIHKPIMDKKMSFKLLHIQLIFELISHIIHEVENESNISSFDDIMIYIVMVSLLWKIK